MHLIFTSRVDLNPEEEKARQAEDKERFEPLLTWLKEQAVHIVRDGSRRVYLFLESCFSDALCHSGPIRSPGH